LEPFLDPLAFHRGVHVCPYERDGTTADSPALVGDLDGDILLALYDNDLDRWKVLRLYTETLDDGTKRVLEKFEADV
jgi:hypothetical protein